jgi:hypothetical protein
MAASVALRRDEARQNPAAADLLVIIAKNTYWCQERHRITDLTDCFPSGYFHARLFIPT